MVGLHLHSSVCLHGILVNQLSTGTTLHFISMMQCSLWFGSWYLSGRDILCTHGTRGFFIIMLTKVRSLNLYRASLVPFKHSHSSLLRYISILFSHALLDFSLELLPLRCSDCYYLCISYFHISPAFSTLLIILCVIILITVLGENGV
jgi:hypothetical protein